MKTITLLTLGTDTDAHYLLALGARLQEQGFKPILAAPSAFQEPARKLNLAFQALETDGEIISQGPPPPHPQPNAVLQQALELARQSSLMVVHQPFLGAIRTLAPLPCPVVAVALQAEEVFSAFNKKEGLWQRLTAWIRRSRGNSTGMPLPALYNFSPQLLTCEEEHTAHLSGYWAIPESMQWKLSGRAPSSGLNDWLYRGGRPVFFDFSQAPEEERELLLKMVKELSGKMGFRAVLCANWANWEEGPLQRDIFHVKSPVQEWLFEQCAAVIHYRQSGKLPAAIRAGVPSILCASGEVAENWGRILRHHGIGIHLRKEPPTIPALEGALEEVLRLSMQYKAKAMGRALREENGLEYAVELICRQAGREEVAMAV